MLGNLVTMLLFYTDLYRDTKFHCFHVQKFKLRHECCSNIRTHYTVIKIISTKPWPAFMRVLPVGDYKYENLTIYSSDYSSEKEPLGINRGFFNLRFSPSLSLSGSKASVGASSIPASDVSCTKWNANNQECDKAKLPGVRLPKTELLIALT